jgi:hypothetical protein
VPRDGWLEEWERQAILDIPRQFPLEGYRRMSFMMLDRDVVAAGPSTVYRVLKAAGREAEIFAARDRRLEETRARRKARRPLHGNGDHPIIAHATNQRPTPIYPPTQAAKNSNSW